MRVTFARYDPEYAKAYRDRKRAEREAKRAAGIVAPPPKPKTPPPKRQAKSTVAQGAAALDRAKMPAACACPTPLDTSDAVTASKSYRSAPGDGERWFTENVHEIFEADHSGKTVSPHFRREDIALTRITARQFPHLPHVGTVHDVDNAVKDGWIEVWRGGDELGHKSFRYDVRYAMGRGIYGDGVYTSVDANVAHTYASRMQWNQATGVSKPGTVARMAINPNAKIVTWKKLMKEWDAWHGDREVSKKGVRNSRDDRDGLVTGYAYDEGRFAAMRGYDVIHVQNKEDGSGKRRPPWADQYIILNRSAIIIEESDR